MSSSADMSMSTPTSTPTPTPLAERALSVVVANEESTAIAERDALLARIAELEKENQFLRDGGPRDGRFAIAVYRLEQRFRIPDDATDWYIQDGCLHYRTADGKFDLETSFVEDQPCVNCDANWSHPDEVHCMDKDVDDAWQQYVENDGSVDYGQALRSSYDGKPRRVRVES